MHLTSRGAPLGPLPASERGSLPTPCCGVRRSPLFPPLVPAESFPRSVWQADPVHLQLMLKAAQKTLFICESCGFRSAKWLGKCTGCGRWNTLREDRAEGSGPRAFDAPNAIPYLSVEHQRVGRIPTGNREFDRVLGGGIVPGSVVMLGGEPGIGKSTLLLQIADDIAATGRSVLYVAGEESVGQIKLRGERLGIRGQDLMLVSETRLEGLLAGLEKYRPGILIVDSIQTLRSMQSESAAGSTPQICECADKLLEYAKKTDTPVFLIGHITKDGSLAGPKALEHVVDVVLYFEGDRNHQHKIIRAVKNRFGASNEMGLFEMTGKGLICVEDPSQFFLSQRPICNPGSAVLCTIEGSRALLVELQALVSPSGLGTARRMSDGIDRNRLNLHLAMLEKRFGLNLLSCDVYVNAVGGLKLSEPAVDLALVAAIVSSYREQPLDPDTAFCGEVGLTGEVRPVNLIERRARESLQAGFSRLLLPASNLSSLPRIEGLKVSGIASVAELLEALPVHVPPSSRG